MSGGQQGGPMMGGGKGGTQQMPAGGGKGGPQAPQGHMMPNGQRQTRPSGPPPGRGMPQMQPGQGFGQYLQSLGGMGQQAIGSVGQNFLNSGQPTPQTYPGQPSGGLPPQQIPVGQPQANFGMSQQQPRQLSGLLAKLYGG